ncbi:MAG: outer membrane beta-barrel protein [Bacteroidales bacterium]|nr:outer membrane beta-barrel protein [Bacteroidales bacterium]
METTEKSAHQSRGRRWTALLFALVSSITLCMAQPGRGFKMTAEGTVIDSKTSEPLYAATVKVTSADGGTGTFGITDSIGHFTFDVERPGKYTLELTYMGYKALTKEVNIWPGRGAKLGTFKMEEDANYLKEVETVARNQRVKQNGDTIVYNADAYKVQDGATAEDLVKKMPGIEVTDEGVKAQGETVEKVLVDGKSFFENDPKLALKTLPAEVVQSVSVFDKKSDQSEFTGFDDGNTVKAMDLTTKSYRRNGAFGKVYGSLGDNFDLDHLYWNAGFNLNLFSGNRRISLLGMSNNVNQQNFTFDDLMSSGGMGGGFGGRMGMRMGNQAGVSRANAFGLNFNDSYLDEKLEVQGSYFFNNLRTVYENESQTDNYAIHDSITNTDRYQSAIANSNSLSHNYNHTVNMRINYKPTDTDQFIFRPSVTIQKSDNTSESTSDIWSLPLDTVLKWDDVTRADRSQMYNYSRSLSSTDNTSWNANGQLTWRHRFSTNGRTLSSTIEGGASGSSSLTNSIRMGSAIAQSETFRNSDSDQNNWSAGGNLQYTEPLGEHSQLSLRYNVNYSKSDRDNAVGFDDYGNTLVDYYYSTFHTGMDSIDGRNSSKYISTNLRHGAELGYRLHTETINMMGGLNLQASRLEGEQDYYAWDETTMGQNPNFNTSRNYFSVLPNMRFEWSPVQGTSVNVDYRARTSNPSISNLQELVNTSNPMSYTTGNKDLDQSTSHNVNVRFIHSNMEKATNIMLFANYSFQMDYIGTQYVTNYSDASLPMTEISWINALSAEQQKQYQNLSLAKGATFSRPVNMDGYRNASVGLSYGFPWDLVMSNVNLGLNANYSITPSQQLYYTYDSINSKFHATDFTSKVKNFSISPRLFISSNISQDLDFSLSYSPTYQKVTDEVNENNNYEYFNQSANARLNWTFWKNFTLEQDLSYTYYGGASMPSVIDEWIWNMSVGKKFGKKNSTEVKLQIYDLLNQRTGYSRNVSSTGITQSYTNYMPRYFMLTVSYKIANYKSSSELKERRRGAGGFGGPRF